MGKVIGLSNTAASIERMARRRPVIAMGFYVCENGDHYIFYAENDVEEIPGNAAETLGSLELLKQHVLDHEASRGGLAMIEMDGSIDDGDNED